ncbi:hypothetical protein Rhow_005032 [Rhodococcus wratislaviensis]|uniref:Uncharacterized protein n=1 Tax=Rhodococcus wratislaviensis TaxID=44752 RepID=A0A402CCS9_RHOWR|nr:hypothetical protein Rhow_005032 [Rhodococcus wratislaviensis]
MTIVTGRGYRDCAVQRVPVNGRLSGRPALDSWPLPAD